MFAILVLMFGDILSAFGSFSNDYVAWSVGLALAIIGANFKLVMLFAATGFALVSGAGVFAAILGVLVPFVIYIVVHLLFLYNIKNFRNQANFRQGIADITRGVRASKTFGKAVRSK